MRSEFPTPSSSCYGGRANRALAVLQSLLLAGLFLVTVPAYADNILVYGEEGELRSKLETVYKDALTEHTVFASDTAGKNSDLAIVVGANALERFCSQDHSTPVIVTHAYERRLRQAKKECEQPIRAVFYDAPLNAQLALADALFSGEKSASLTSASTSAEKSLSRDIDYWYCVKDQSIYQAIKELVETRRGWSVFLMEMDPTLYEGIDYRVAVETLVRYRKAVIAPVQSLVKAGAVAGVFYNDESLEKAMLRSVQGYLAGGDITDTRPDHLSVAINHSILRILFGRKLTQEQVQAIESRVNER